MAADPAVGARLRALLPNARLVQDYRLHAPGSRISFKPLNSEKTGLLVLVLDDPGISHHGRVVGEHLHVWIADRLLDPFRAAESVRQL